jgi:hypothetical protein
MTKTINNARGKELFGQVTLSAARGIACNMLKLLTGHLYTQTAYWSNFSPLKEFPLNLKYAA